VVRHLVDDDPCRCEDAEGARRWVPDPKRLQSAIDNDVLQWTAFGELSDEGSWPVSKFRSLQPSERKRKMMTRLVQEMCECSQEDEE
jgi:hypothetical protein